MAKSNAEHVNKIARIAKEFGIEPASPDEARKILNLKGIDKVNFLGTLFGRDRVRGEKKWILT